MARPASAIVVLGADAKVRVDDKETAIADAPATAIKLAVVKKCDNVDVDVKARGDDADRGN